MLSKLTNILRWAGAAVLLLLVVMLMVEGTWAVHLYHSWLFVSVVMLATVLLIISGMLDVWHRRWAAATSHLGLSMVLLGGMMGAVVETDVKMVVDSYASERVAYGKNGEAVVLPFSIRLQDFCIDYYDDAKSPKQYTSTLLLTPAKDKASEGLKKQCSVNHPIRYKGWWIYQWDYDHAQEDFVVLQLVHDPWIPMVYAGFLLMAIGALIETRKAWHSWKVLPAALVIAGIFTAASLARVEMGTLVPALRSLWFFPHILIYMIAYSLLAIALVLSITGLFQKGNIEDRKINCSLLAQRLLTTASSLLLIGMLCGAVWAKDAWGQYWTWDAKECWAAVTWMLTIVGSHLPLGKTKPWRTLIVILLTFAAMQITWYGVNYLPSSEYSMHTYNTK